MNYSVDYNMVFLRANPYFGEPSKKHEKNRRHFRRGVACFSDIYRYNGTGMIVNRGDAGPDYIEYHAKVREETSPEVLSWYIEFLKTWLLPGTFKYKFTHKNTRILFVLNTKNMSRACALMHLTAFRYVDEFWEVLNPFIKACKDKPMDDDLRFRVFIALNYYHSDDCYNMSGHGLIYKEYGLSYGRKSKKAVMALASRCPTIEEVRKRTETSDSVQTHFTLKPLRAEAINHEPKEKEEANDDDWV